MNTDPNINTIRADFIRDHTHHFDEYQAGRSLTSEQEFYGRQFDRTLAAEIRKAKAEAWDEGRDEPRACCGDCPLTTCPWDDDKEGPTNPYREPPS